MVARGNDFIATMLAQRATKPIATVRSKAKGDTTRLATAPAAVDFGPGADVEVEEAVLEEVVIVEAVLDANPVDVIEAVEFASSDDDLL
jgi:hypothetical protein